MKRVEILVRKPAPTEALKEGRIESNGASHRPPKIRPAGSVARKIANKRDLIVISSPEDPPPKMAKREKAKSSVQTSKPKKRKAEVLESSESSEEERRPAKSLAVPFKFHKKKSTPSSLEDDRKIHSHEVDLKKSRSSLASRVQVLSPHSIQYDRVKKIVRPRLSLDPLPSVKGKANSSIRSDKKVSTSNLKPFFLEVLFISNPSGKRKVIKFFRRSQ